MQLTDYNFECGMIWDIHHKPMLDAFNHYFNRLRVVKLKSFKFSQSELELLKILLQKSRFLEYLILVTPKNGRTKLYAPNTPDYKQLINTWQATPRVRVALFPHSNDKSGVFASHPKYWYWSSRMVTMDMFVWIYIKKGIRNIFRFFICDIYI